MSIFGEEGTPTAGGALWDNAFILSKRTLSEAGDVSKLTIYCGDDAGYASSWKGLIYNDDGDAGKPGTLMGVSEVLSLGASAAAASRDLTFTSPIALTAGIWWIGIVLDCNASGPDLWYTSSVGIVSCWGDGAGDGSDYTTPPDPYDLTYNSNSSAYCINATYVVPVAPTLTTTAISAITATTASSGGTITDEGSAAVTDYGVCWNTTGTPTIADSHTHDKP